MKKLLLGLVLVSAVSANAFAIEITNGKLLSHKEWKTGNISGTFKEVTPKNKKFGLMQALEKKRSSPSLTADSIYVDSKMNDGQVVAGYTSEITGLSEAYIFNPSESVHTYKITNIITACFYKTDMPACMNESLTTEHIVQINPHGRLGMTLLPSITRTYEGSGTDFITLETVVEKDGSMAEFHTMSAGSVDVADIVLDTIANNN